MKSERMLITFCQKYKQFSGIAKMDLDLSFSGDEEDYITPPRKASAVVTPKSEVKLLGYYLICHVKFSEAWKAFFSRHFI